MFIWTVNNNNNIEKSIKYQRDIVSCTINESHKHVFKATDFPLEERTF